MQELEEANTFVVALDVTDPEPIPLDDPLLTLENAIITPHIASASVATRSRMARRYCEALPPRRRDRQMSHRSPRGAR